LAIILGLVGWLILPASNPAAAAEEPSFSIMLWQERGLDVMVQIGLIFADVMGILGILAETEPGRIRVPAPELDGEVELSAVIDASVITAKES
jgi:hypothetical protein